MVRSKDVTDKQKSETLALRLSGEEKGLRSQGRKGVSSLIFQTDIEDETQERKRDENRQPRQQESRRKLQDFQRHPHCQLIPISGVLSRKRHPSYSLWDRHLGMRSHTQVPVPKTILN